MHEAHLTTREYQAKGAIDDLAVDSLRLLVPVIMGAAWLWTAYVALFDAAHSWQAYAAFAALTGSGIACLRLANRQVTLAVTVFLIGYMTSVTIMSLSLSAAAVYYLFIPAVLIAMVMADLRAIWSTALCASCLIVWSTFVLELSAQECIVSLLLIGFTALSAWLSQQRLLTALNWALNMTEQSQRNAEDAREHRAELQKVLHSLDIAYTRLERTNQALIFAQEAAEHAYRFKSDFVANVSHELRTPLNLIVGFSEMMTTAPESYGNVPLPREYRGDMMATYRSARHLLDLINDVLDLSQMEAGRMTVRRESVRLDDIVLESVEMVRGLAEARGLKLTVDLPSEALTVFVDPTRTRQVLLNLLTNAMRYTDQGWVSISVHKQESSLELCVRDSGRGIAPQNLQQAFEAFSRLHEGQIKDGSGLGLAVSRKFVELHGGKMWIESTLGKGTAVFFTLPLPDERESLSLSRVSMRPVAWKQRQQAVGLVLHDDERVIDLLARQIDTCQFALAATPADAKVLMDKLLPNVIIMDTLWQNRWGDPFQDSGIPLPIPVITCALPDMHHAGVIMGATDFLPKPVMRQDLASALKRLPRPPRTALVVDDDPHIVRLIGRMLRAIDESMEVIEAFGGQEGLSAALTQRPDVIFVDLLMPEISGYDIIRILGKEPTLANSALIVVSVRSVEHESAPVTHDIWLRRYGGFTLSETLQALSALISATTQPAAVSPASAAALLKAPPG